MYRFTYGNHGSNLSTGDVVAHDLESSADNWIQNNVKYQHKIQITSIMQTTMDALGWNLLFLNWLLKMSLAKDIFKKQFKNKNFPGLFLVGIHWSVFYGVH